MTRNMSLSLSYGTRTSVIVGIAVAILQLNAATLAGQSPTVPGRVATLIVLVDSIANSNDRAQVLRRVGSTHQDVIVVARGSRTGYTLASAVFALLTARALQGDTAATASRIRVRPNVPRAWFRNGEMAAAIATMQRVNNQPLRYIPGVGLGQAVTVQLSNRARLRNSISGIGGQS